jgi:hypothetical protein
MRDSLFCRLRARADRVTPLITLPCLGCPVQAVVTASGLHERTIVDWRDRAGRPGQRLHEHRIPRGLAESGHAQADELYACWCVTAG